MLRVKSVLAFCIIIVGGCLFPDYLAVEGQHGGGGAHAGPAQNVITLVTSFEPSAVSAGVPTRVFLQLQIDGSSVPTSAFRPLFDRRLHVLLIAADYSHLFHIQPEDFNITNSTHFGVRATFPVSGTWLVVADYQFENNAVVHLGGAWNIIQVSGTPAQGTRRIDLQRRFIFRTNRFSINESYPNAVNRYGIQGGTAAESDVYDVELLINPTTNRNITAGICNRLELNIRFPNGSDAILAPYLAAPLHFYSILQHVDGTWVVGHSTGTIRSRATDSCTVEHEGLANGLVTFPGPLATNFNPSLGGNHFFFFQTRALSSDGAPEGQLLTATFDVRVLDAPNSASSLIGASPLVILLSLSVLFSFVY